MSLRPPSRLRSIHVSPLPLAGYLRCMYQVYHYRLASAFPLLRILIMSFCLQLVDVFIVVL